MTLLKNSGNHNADEHGVTGKELKLKYQNNLPELPFDPKFLTYSLEPFRFLQYVATSLERSYKHELLSETDVGVEVDLIDPDVFRIDKSDDERLLEDETPVSSKSRKSRHQTSVSWLRKTEYISTEVYNRWNKSEKVESNVKRHLNEDAMYRDRESQIQAIEQTFKAAAKPIYKHYSKPNVYAVEALPVFPDFALWRFPCAQVIFDDDPVRKQKSADAKDEVNQAMIRGMVDESGDHFVAYFLPSEETKELRRLDTENQISYTDGAAYEYELTREYNWNVKNKTMANYEENYFFVFRKDGVYYNELETRVRLSKRRKLNSSQPGVSSSALQMPKTRLVVHHRDFTDDELKAQTDRLYMLEHEVEGDDDDDEAEEEEEGGGGPEDEGDKDVIDEMEQDRESTDVDEDDEQTNEVDESRDLFRSEDRESKEMKGNVSSPYHQSKVVDSGYGRKKIASKQVRLPFSSEDEDEEELDSELSDLSD